jgi:hypothetical protein
MPTCDCCRKDKPDAKVHKALHPTDAQGRRSQNEFLGFLCEDCEDCLARLRLTISPAPFWASSSRAHVPSIGAIPGDKVSDYACSP